MVNAQRCPSGWLIVDCHPIRQSQIVLPVEENSVSLDTGFVNPGHMTSWRQWIKEKICSKSLIRWFFNSGLKISMKSVSATLVPVQAEIRLIEIGIPIFLTTAFT